MQNSEPEMQNSYACNDPETQDEMLDGDTINIAAQEHMPIEVFPTSDAASKDENCVYVYVDHFRADLACLLKKDPEQLGRVRKVEGTKYSLVDVVVCITGQRSDHAKRAFDDVLLIDPDITHLVGYVNLADSVGRRWGCHLRERFTPRLRGCSPDDRSIPRAGRKMRPGSDRCRSQSIQAHVLRQPCSRC